MWIYLTEGSFSIVAHRDKPDHLLVRSRQPDAIERAFPNEEMYFDPDADYPYRADIHRLDVADFITKDHLCMPSIGTSGDPLIVESKITRRRLLVIRSRDKMISRLDKSNYMIRRVLSRSKLSDSVVLQTPCS